MGPEAADAEEGAALAEVMSGVVTAAVGYDVRVKAKWCEEAEGGSSLYGVWPLLRPGAHFVGGT